MPVISTEPEEIELWLKADWKYPRTLQRALSGRAHDTSSKSEVAKASSYQVPWIRCIILSEVPLLRRRTFPRDCEAAARIATALFSIYLSGVRERDRLRQMVEVG